MPRYTLRTSPHRTIMGLKEAHFAPVPRFLHTRQVGKFAAGIRFERQVAAILPKSAQRGLWWDFVDQNGRGSCQTDYLLHFGDHIIVVECKYTDCPAAISQLTDLYLPVVGMALGFPVFGTSVVHNLTPESDPSLVFPSLQEALPAILAGHIPKIHWLGAIVAPKRPVPERLPRPRYKGKFLPKGLNSSQIIPSPSPGVTS